MKTLVLLLVFILSISVYGQITFEKRYLFYEDFNSSSVVQTTDSGFVIAGSIGAGNQKDGCFLRTDKYGDTIWLKKTGSIGTDYATSVILSNDNSYVFTGGIQVGNGDVNLNLAKINNNGIFQWSNNYGSPDSEKGYSLIQTIFNEYIAVGYSHIMYQSYDFYVMKADVYGDFVWEKIIGGSNNDYAYSVCEATNNTCIVAGSTASNEYDIDDIYLVKLNNYGNIVWSKTYGSEIGWYGECAYCIQPTFDGNYFVTALLCIIGVNENKILTLKIDENGDTLWTKTYGGNESYFGTTGIPTNDGGYAITGSVWHNNSAGKDILLLKTDDVGNLLWTKQYGKTGNETGECIKQTSDGGYVITGNRAYSYSYLIKTDSLGRVVPYIDTIMGQIHISHHDTITYYCIDSRGEDYNWTTGFGEVVSGQGNDTVSISWDQMGIDTIKVDVSNVCGMDSKRLIIQIDTCDLPLLSAIYGNFYVWIYTVEEYYVNLLEGTAPVNYWWDVYGGTILSGQNTTSIVVEWNYWGSGSIGVTATNDCGNDIQQNILEILTSGVPENDHHAYSVFPNPTQGIINIEFPVNTLNYEIEIFDLRGRLILQRTMVPNNSPIDLKEFEKGIYLLKIIMNDKTNVEKILLQ